MSGEAGLTDRQRSRLQFALEILTRHRDAVDRAAAAMREVLNGEEEAEWARVATVALREEIGDSRRDFVRNRLGLLVEQPGPVATEKAAVENLEPRGER